MSSTTNHDRNPQPAAFSRRYVLRTAGVGLTSLAFAPILSACGGNRSQPSSAPTTGGSFTGAFATAFRDLDPTSATTGASFCVMDFVYEALYDIDPFPPRAVTPRLAAALPEAVSPTVHRVQLRPDVTFHDGSALTADDVVFTITRMLDPETNSAHRTSLEIIKVVRATADDEIELELVHPTSLLPQRLALVRVLSEAAVAASPDALKLQPVGTGPYQVISAQSENSITLEKSDSYSGSGNIGYDTLEISVATDANARISGLQTKQYKAIEGVPASAYETLQQEDVVEIESVPGGFTTYIMFHMGVPPFNDVRVRQALMHAIDRDSITDNIFFGQAEAAWDYLLPPLFAGATEINRPYDYDPERARSLLAEAGYIDQPTPIDFLITNLDQIAPQAPIIEQNLRDAGFELTMIPGEISAHADRAVEGRYHAWLTAADAGKTAADAEYVLRWLYAGIFVPTQARWSGAGLDDTKRLLDEAVGAADEPTRDARLQEAQNIIQDDGPMLPLHFVNQITAWSDSLRGFRPLPTIGFVLDGVEG